MCNEAAYTIYVLGIIMVITVNGNMVSYFKRREKVVSIVNKILRKILSPKRDEERGDWRKLHNLELQNLYGNTGIIKPLKSCRLRWLGHVVWMGNGKRAHTLLLGKPEEKRPCGRLKIRCEDNIIRDLKEIDYEGDWKTLAQYRVTWSAYILAAMNPRVP